MSKTNQSARSALRVLTLIAMLVASHALAATVLFTGATVHTISDGTLSPGQVLARDGKIVSVGTNLSTEGAQVIDLKGLHLFPGLIAMDSALGLNEISGVRSTVDAAEPGEYHPDVESWIAVNPDSELIPVARANGIAYFEPVPQGGIISGQSGLVSVDGWTMEERTFKKPLALHFFWPSMDLNLAQRDRSREKGKAKSPQEQAKERRTKIRAANDFFEEARAYAKAKDAEGKAGATTPQLVPAWEAMLPFIKGTLPITVHADSIRQIRAAVEWATTNHYKIILAGGRDAWMAADLLATNKIPVIYGQVFALPPRDSASYDVQFAAPAVLQKAGVQVVISFGVAAFDAPFARDLPYYAAQAVAFGLPETEAIKAITLYPAQIAGVADRLGSIAPGKEATLFAADGDILDIRSNVKRMWVSGKEISLESRHTRLYEKYKSRPRP